MSRCFPFPPPGYEAKSRSEHKDLLSEEKRKAKKQKKGKKDGRERERKEKDRGHRKDKHSKKHKREKRQDRRKKKERDKEKRETLERVTRENDDLGKMRLQEMVHNETVKDSAPTNELASQIISQGSHAKHTGSDTSKLLPGNIECIGVEGSKEKERISHSRRGEKLGQIAQSDHAGEKGKGKTRVQNGTSLQVASAEKHSTTTRMHGGNRAGLQQESSKGVVATTAVTHQNGRLTPSPTAWQRTKQVDQHPDGSSHSTYRNIDSMSTKWMMEKKNGSANNLHTMAMQLVQGKNGASQGNARIKEVKANHRVGVKDGNRGQGVNHKGVKDRDRDHSVKKRKAKDGNEGKYMKRRGVVNEQKQRELDGHQASMNYVHDLMDSALLNGNKFTSDDVKKRKDLKANSSLHEHSMRLTKVQRTSAANHPQGTAPYSSTLPLSKNSCKANMLQDSKECYNNGITGSHYQEEHKASVSSSSYDSIEVSLAPPHPDTKYLSQVYSVPAVDGRSEHIDQDWLFSGDRVHRKPTMFEATESPQVWAEAQPIDSADVVALPYVVPL